MRDAPNRVGGQPRLPEVDAIRGVALAGIAVVNLPYMALPQAMLSQQPDAAHDYLTAVAIELLLEGKVFTLFAFMFGWGFGVQMSAAQQAAAGSRPMLRRLLALLAIGAAHAAFVFYGDVLALYALLGFVLWAMQGFEPRRLLGIGAVLLVVTAGGLYLLWRGVGDHVLLFQAPLSFAAFVAGLAAEKAGFLERESAGWRAFRQRLGWLLLPAVGGSVAHVAALNGWLVGEVGAIAYASLAFGGPALAALYLYAVVTLARRGAVGGLVYAAGRLSLTVYVATSIVGAVIFRSWGAGLFGTLGYATLFAVAAAIWLLLASLSWLWLRLVTDRGPLELLLGLVARGVRSKRA
jgi:uncharacterized protein